MATPCTVQASLGLLLLLAASPAVAQQAADGVAATPPKTVSWYADHRPQRAQVQLACLDDPGRLARTPDCINAHEASVEVALRQARARTGTLDPQPRFLVERSAKPPEQAADVPAQPRTGILRRGAPLPPD